MHLNQYRPLLRPYPPQRTARPPASTAGKPYPTAFAGVAAKTRTIRIA